MTPRRLHDIAHARTGDKGDTLTLSIFAYRPADYPVLRASATVARLRAHLDGIVAGEIVRYDLPLLDGVHFVCRQALKGGVNTSLALDSHGKSLSFAALSLPLVEGAADDMEGT
jgi:hypothetical protein